LKIQTSNPVNGQPVEQSEPLESVLSQPGSEKKQFVEPVVSVPVDVLEATTFFQSPTLDTSDVL